MGAKKKVVFVILSVIANHAKLLKVFSCESMLCLFWESYLNFLKNVNNSDSPSAQLP